MRAARGWMLAAVLGLVWSAPAAAHPPAPGWSARKPPPKASTKRKNPAPRKKPRKKQSALLAAQEEELHTERLAVLGRFKEVNETLRDAELTATIRRLEELETRRHGLMEKVVAATLEQERAEENP